MKKNTKELNNKRKYIIVGIAVLVIIIAGITFYLYKSNMAKEYNKYIETIGVKSVKEINYDIPSFTLLTEGIYDNTITNDDVKNLKVYEIETVMNDGIYKDAYSYVGVRLKDVLKMAKMETFNTLTFMARGNLQVTYEFAEISDDMYLVFEMDGYKYDYLEPIAIINPNLNSRYSITGLTTLLFDWKWIEEFRLFFSCIH